MAPGIALNVMAESKKPVRVLDPMMGSGTVIAMARSKGHRAIGIDIDPLAVLITKVWTTAIDTEEVREKAIEVLARARIVFDSLPHKYAYPRHADRETRRFITYWFDEYARRQLASLSTVLSGVRKETLREVLWCSFSRLIITKQSGASLAMDLSHSRPHKSFDRAPSKPFRKFLQMVDRVIENCIDQGKAGRGPAPLVRLGDARNLPLADSSIDLVLTSPPYLNAIDYMRCSKFTLVWMGHKICDLRRLHSESVGAGHGLKVIEEDKDIRNIMKSMNLRPRLAHRDERILARYIAEMRRTMGEVARVLSPKGTAVYVIGENTISGTYVRNSRIVSAVAELSGLKLQETRTRSLPPNRRYLPPPTARSNSGALDARMRREVILKFTKPAGFGCRLASPVSERVPIYTGTHRSQV